MVTPSTCSANARARIRSEEHTSELQSQSNLVCRLLLEKKKKNKHSLKSREKKRQKIDYLISTCKHMWSGSSSRSDRPQVILETDTARQTERAHTAVAVN